ncbi:hypothetical protein [Prevotella sp. oral taxon 299]|uniref:hypothetical protein n=1 Tax=Prevotella sp. oral taxon 299 TaxID=652716 RepID=UPI0001C3F800|nr:hypothetical protein [Prevotella sp. oral taxon 299]EFC71519.1 hypothetical protein HMPREF0669_00191 [Prevotella sp. oral taxon 299 str. F0039]
MEEKKFNVQKRCEEIHAQYGTSEMANYRIQLMCDKIENRAFEAGRKSVLESIPELKWKDEDRRGDEENYIEESYSLTPFGDYSILKWYTPTDITLYFNGEHFKSGITSVQQAKQEANEDYKKRIKQVLGL